MSHHIIKPDRDTDFYVLWSTNTECPLAAGSRDALASDIREHEGLDAGATERFDAADRYGTSARHGTPRALGYADAELIVGEPLPELRVLPRKDLAAYARAVLSDDLEAALTLTRKLPEDDTTSAVAPAPPVSSPVTMSEASQELIRAAEAVQDLKPRRSWSDSRVMGYRDALRAVARMLTESAGTVDPDAAGSNAVVTLRDAAGLLRGWETWADDKAFVRGWEQARDDAAAVVEGRADAVEKSWR